MRKPLLIIAASSLISGLSVTEAEAIEPNFPCFMKNSSGRVINLSQLCSSKPVTPLKLQPNLTPNISSRQSARNNEYLVGDGKGGSYYYQLWLNSSTSKYKLKIWLSDSYPQGEGREIPFSFPSSRDALNYFDCNFSEYYSPTEKSNCREVWSRYGRLRSPNPSTRR